jgi:hypothetical protein
MPLSIKTKDAIFHRKTRIKLGFANLEEFRFQKRPQPRDQELPQCHEGPKRRKTEGPQDQTEAIRPPEAASLPSQEQRQQVEDISVQQQSQSSGAPPRILKQGPIL